VKVKISVREMRLPNGNEELFQCGRPSCNRLNKFVSNLQRYRKCPFVYVMNVKKGMYRSEPFHRPDFGLLSA